MTKRTHSSVTEIACECGYLESAANDPDSPIIFDQRTGEYQFQYDETNRSRLRSLFRAIWGNSSQDATLIIYHCPFCGGAAPESKRHLLFEVIPAEEERRLSELLQRIKSIDDALQQLGKPSFEGYSVSRTPESENQPSRIEHHRDIRYHGLSNVADVWIMERSDGTAYWQLHGKPKTNPNHK